MNLYWPDAICRRVERVSNEDQPDQIATTIYIEHPGERFLAVTLPGDRVDQLPEPGDAVVLDLMIGPTIGDLIPDESDG